MDILTKITRAIKIEKAKLRKKQNAINWGIIGTGPMSDFFCKALTLMPDSNIYAVSSRTKSKAIKFSKKHKIQNAYDNYHEMLLNDNIDIVYIATPVFTHFRIGRDCLEMNKNVLIEKPLSYTLTEAQTLVEIANKNKKFLMEAMWSKCLPTIKKVKDFYLNKNLGELKSIRVDLSKNVIINPDRVEFSPDYGGVLLDYGIYPLALVLEFLEDDYKVDYKQKIDTSLGTDSSWNIVLSDNNATAHITISNQFTGSQSCTFYFEEGNIVLPRQFNRTNEIHYYNKNNELINIERFKYLFEGFEYQISEVHTCLKKQAIESRLVSHKSTLKSMELADYLVH